MKKLIAKRPILYGSRMYEAGDTLPANDDRMVNAWLAAESAELIDTEKAIECADQEIADIPADETAADAHIDPAQLEGMSKDELKKLAEGMGVSTSFMNSHQGKTQPGSLHVPRFSRNRL